MRKNFVPAVCALALVLSACDLQLGYTNGTGGSGDLAPSSSVWYKLEVINNTDTAVRIHEGQANFGEGYAHTHTPYFMADAKNFENRSQYMEIDAQNTRAMAMSYISKANMVFPDLFDEMKNMPSPEEILESFSPYLCSFYLGIELGEDQYYIAGWPESLALPTETTNEANVAIPCEKIIQYGVGYSDNTEVRFSAIEYFNAPDGAPVYSMVPYNPLSFQFHQDGQTEKYDFDTKIDVYMQATLTINGPDDMVFTTNAQSITTEPENFFEEE